MSQLFHDYQKFCEEFQRLDAAYKTASSQGSGDIEWQNLKDFMAQPESVRIIAAVASQPIGFFKERKPKGSPEYILTFTRDPKKNVPDTKWKDAAFKQIHKTWFQRPIKYVYEHEDTNLHMHAHVKTTGRYIGKDNFKMFEREYGLVMIREVGKDNGIQGYFEKENDIKILE